MADVGVKWDKMVTRCGKIMMMVVIIGLLRETKEGHYNYDYNGKDERCEVNNNFKADRTDSGDNSIGLKGQCVATLRVYWQKWNY